MGILNVVKTVIEKKLEQPNLVGLFLGQASYNSISKPAIDSAQRILNEFLAGLDKNTISDPDFEEKATKEIFDQIKEKIFSLEKGRLRTEFGRELKNQEIRDLANNTLIAAANMIGAARKEGFLYKKSSLIAILPNSNWETTITLRSDRLVYGWRAAKLGPNTKVQLSIDGSKQLIQTSSQSVSKSVTRQNTNWINQVPQLNTTGTTNTTYKYSLGDTRTAQLLITDKRFQINGTYTANQIEQVRAFAEKVQQEIDALSRNQEAAPITKPGIELNQTRDFVAKVKELKKLLDQSLIDQEEFKSAKEKYLK